ncbi:MAG: cobalt-precorrin-7 (C(5))-methyltransferase [Methanothrix sp.]|nr:cobalt-precorrin-7 (C(5))-methyltransferase [Methanothrix sp.]
MIIVGVGAGPHMLTEQAAIAVARARLIYGSERAIDLVRKHIGSACTVRIIDDYKKLHHLPEDAVVLSTGDPMLSGLGYLKGEVIPGISSLQVACARLKISELLVVPITVHGRKLDSAAIAFELQRGKTVFLLTDEETDLKSLCNYLESHGLHRKIALLSSLGYEQERVELSDTLSPPILSELSCLFIGDL